MVPLRLTFVGSGDAFSTGGRLQSGIFIAGQGGGLLLDCGATLLAGLHRAGLHSNQIDAVVITHLHGDHFCGIPFLLLDALYIKKRSKPLLLIGPEELEDRVVELCRNLYQGALDDLPFRVEYQTLDLQKLLTLEFFSVSAFRVKHGQQTAARAIRIEIDARTIAYTGDTAWTDDLIPLARKSDLLICECCNFSETSPAHLDYLTLQQHLARLDAARIILTHTGPSMDENRQNVSLDIASDGLSLQL